MLVRELTFPDNLKAFPLDTTAELLDYVGSAVSVNGKDGIVVLVAFYLVYHRPSFRKPTEKGSRVDTIDDSTFFTKDGVASKLKVAGTGY
jgi:hypothetical protein